MSVDTGGPIKTKEIDVLKRTSPGLLAALAFMAAAPSFAAEHRYTFTGQATTGPYSERYGEPEAITGAVSGTLVYNSPSLPSLGLREETRSLPEGGSRTFVYECCQSDGTDYASLVGNEYGLLTWTLAWASGTDFRRSNFEGGGGWIDRTLLADGSSVLSIGSSAPPIGRNPDDQGFQISFFSDSDLLYRSPLGAIPFSEVTSIKGAYLGYSESTGVYRNFTFVATVAPAVPEPTTIALVLAGLAALPVWQRGR